MKRNHNIPVKLSRHFLFWFSLLCILHSCNKEPKYKTSYLDAGLKAAFNNKPGSYWIYRDSITGETDSVYLTESILKIYTGNATIKGLNYEELNLSFDSKHIGVDTSYRLVLSMNFDTEHNHYFVCGIKNAIMQPLNFWFTYPLTHLGAVHNKKDTVVHFKLTTPLVLGGHTFNNVTVVNQYAKADASQGSTGFWTDRWGFVKMRFLCQSPSGPVIRVMELQRWKIIQ